MRCGRLDAILFELMIRFCDADDHALAVAEIRDQLQLDASTVARVVSPLIKCGLIACCDRKTRRFRLLRSPDEIRLSEFLGKQESARPLMQNTIHAVLDDLSLSDLVTLDRHRRA